VGKKIGPQDARTMRDIYRATRSVKGFKFLRRLLGDHPPENPHGAPPTPPAAPEAPATPANRTQKRITTTLPGGLRDLKVLIQVQKECWFASVMQLLLLVQSKDENKKIFSECVSDSLRGLLNELGDNRVKKNFVTHGIMKVYSGITSDRGADASINFGFTFNLICAIISCGLLTATCSGVSYRRVTFITPPSYAGNLHFINIPIAFFDIHGNIQSMDGFKDILKNVVGVGVTILGGIIGLLERSQEKEKKKDVAVGGHYITFTPHGDNVMFIDTLATSEGIYYHLEEVPYFKKHRAINEIQILIRIDTKDEDAFTTPLRPR
jgi:hypothetical protein